MPLEGVIPDNCYDLKLITRLKTFLALWEEE